MKNIILTLLLIPMSSPAITCDGVLQGTPAPVLSYSKDQRMAWIKEFDEVLQIKPGLRNLDYVTLNRVKNLSHDLMPTQAQVFYGILNRIFNNFKYVQARSWEGLRDTMDLFVIQSLNANEYGIEGNLTYRFLKYFRDNLDKPEVLKELYTPSPLVTDKAKWINELQGVVSKLKASTALSYQDHQQLNDFLTLFFYRAETVNVFLANTLGVPLAVQIPLVGISDPYTRAATTVIFLSERTATTREGKRKNALLSFLESILETDLNDEKLEKLYERK